MVFGINDFNLTFWFFFSCHLVSFLSLSLVLCNGRYYIGDFLEHTIFESFTSENIKP